jgi:exodeoxyribonuclease V gamma subunit
VGLADLVRLLLHPVRGFLSQRLDVGVPADQALVADALPVEIGGLEAWEVGDRVLRAVLAGAEPAAVLAAERLRGALPPLQLGTRQLAVIEERAHALWSATRAARELPARSVDVTVELADGRRLTGVVPDVRGNRVVRVHYSNLGPKHRLASWVDLLALSAARPDASWTASTFGWHRTGPRHSLLGPVDHTVHDLLAQLVELYDRGLCAPLPLPLGTGHAWAESRRARRDADRSARTEWEGSESSPVPGERDDAWHERLLGRAAPFEVLLDPPQDDERWGSEATRLGEYAGRLWEPLFEAETWPAA